MLRSIFLTIKIIIIITKKEKTRGRGRKGRDQPTKPDVAPKMVPPSEYSEKHTRLNKAAQETSKLAKPGGKASEIKVQLLFLLFKSLYISCKFSLLANTQK